MYSPTTEDLELQPPLKRSSRNFTPQDAALGSLFAVTAVGLGIGAALYGIGLCIAGLPLTLARRGGRSI